MRIVSAALSLTFAIMLLPAGAAQAQSARAATQLAKAQSATEFSAQRRRARRPSRILVTPRYHPDDVYPRYYPGPNAVRECTAHLVQEFRPSGTVITPRMNCFWRPG
ncbi:MAG TPA: hypothetical protein VFQ87_11310 [Bradyrhizobium sp.]|nr:hypothetical protein [Bradyrhizobium sp.]